MEYNNEIKELTGFDVSKIDGIIRCPECGLEMELNEDNCDNCGCYLQDD